NRNQFFGNQGKKKALFPFIHTSVPFQLRISVSITAPSGQVGKNRAARIIVAARLLAGERNAGIVLDDDGSFDEQEVANDRELARVQEIGGALYKTVSGRQRLAKFQKFTAVNTVVGKVGAEII